jgi:energy-coupling factor transporter ATP-binding protein EcfA2
VEEGERTIKKLRLSNLGVHGRRNEMRLLEECLERMYDDDSTISSINTNSSELVLIGGYSGTGKSTLAGTLQKAVKRKRRGGKQFDFDFELRDRPYAGIIEACREICKEIIELETSKPTTFKDIRNDLLKTFTNNGTLEFRTLP